MSPALAYARALSLPGGGWRRAWAEVAALVGAGGVFVDSPIPVGIQVFGAVLVTLTPVVVAQGGTAIDAVGPQALALPSLPLTSSDRVWAALGLSALRMLPAAVVVAAVGGHPGFVAARLAGAVGMLAVWLVGVRLAETRSVAGRLAVVGGFAGTLTVAATPWALVPGALSLLLLPSADPVPGEPLRQAVGLPGYISHRLDEATGGRPLLAAAQRDAARLGLRDGLAIGGALLVMLAAHTALLGKDPAGDVEELRAALVWGVTDNFAWLLVFFLLGLAVLVVVARSFVLPGHSSHPAARANALTPLRWLPVDRAEVWRHAARVVLAGWGATWAGAMVPLGLGMAWVGGPDAVALVLLALATLALGLTAGLLHAQLGPLAAYEGGPRPPSAGPALLALGVLWLPSVVMLGVVMTAMLSGDTTTVFAAHAGFFVVAVGLLAGVAARHRSLAARAR